MDANSLGFKDMKVMGENEISTSTPNNLRKRQKVVARTFVTNTSKSIEITYPNTMSN